MFEQMIEVTDANGNKHVFRRIRITLAKPTRDGDKRIHIITNVSKSKACAAVVADLYRKRWTIETAFLELAKHLQSEINTLGYPRAALFAFCIALVSYSILSLIMAALNVVHGHEKVDNEVSGYYLADELSGHVPGDDGRVAVWRVACVSHTIVLVMVRPVGATRRESSDGPLQEA